MLNINYPLEVTENGGIHRIRITKESLILAISQMPEHTSIGVMRNALIDVFRAADAGIEGEWSGHIIDRNYEFMHSILMGTASEIGYGLYNSWNREEYQNLYSSKLDILLVTDVIYTVVIKDGSNNILGGFEPFTAKLAINKDFYILPLIPAKGLGYIHLSITQNDGSVYGKYNIANQYLFFTSKQYLNSAPTYNFLHGITQNPIDKKMKGFVILDILKTN